MQEQEIINISSEILEIFLNIRKEKGKDFTIGFRQKDISKEEGKKRLVKGYWFLGSNYIFVPLFKKGDDARKVRTIGFVIATNSKGQRTNYIEISCKGFNLSKQDLRFHQELSNEFNIELNENNCGIYEFEDSEKYLTDNLYFYLNDFRIKAIDLLDKYNLFDDYIISEVKCDKDLNKIIKIKEDLGTVENNVSTNTFLNTKTQPMNIPLNQILYGPPGTSKTYTLQNKFFDTFTKREITITKEEYVKSIIQELSWWQVITLVLLEIKKGKVNDIYEHEYIKVKEQFSKSKTVVPTIWGQLQAHTLLKCPNVNVEKRQEPLYFWKDENSNWSIEKEDLESSYSEIIDIQERVNNYTPEKGVTIKNYEFVTFHQSFTYEDFIEGIKPDLEDTTGSEIKYRIKDGVFKTICKKAQKDPENRYALFIDEINRGNVSAIFGELITLIEESKRLGNEEALEVTLPYSKEKFGVPNNLHIIGTMNTADRSVEALDTALRRRFTFEEMMPDYKVIESENSFGIDLSELLRTINRRIEVLLDRDHLIGHSYFLNVDSLEMLQSRFMNNIIPLLQEYFYGDYGKIGLVLGEGFVKQSKDEKITFAKFTYDGDQEFYSEKIVYTLENKLGEGEFREAIDNLLGKK